jgi:hypothetical protein
MLQNTFLLTDFMICEMNCLFLFLLLRLLNHSNSAYIVLIFILIYVFPVFISLSKLG